MAKRALVLSGGASKGAYQAGVIKRLLLEGEPYDIITGISVGALNGGYLAQYKKENQFLGACDLYNMWYNISNDMVYKKWFAWPLSILWKKSIYNSKPLLNTIRNNISRAKLNKTDVHFECGAISLNSSTMHYFHRLDNEILEAIAASAAFPVFLTPQYLRSRRSWFVDGGARDLTPLKRAIDLGADEVDVVMCQPLGPKKYEKVESPKVWDVGLNTLDILMHEIMINDIKIAKMYNKLTNVTNKRYVKINLITPNFDLRTDVFDFSPHTARRNLIVGFNQGIM